MVKKDVELVEISSDIQRSRTSKKSYIRLKELSIVCKHIAIIMASKIFIGVIGKAQYHPSIEPIIIIIKSLQKQPD